MATKTQTVETQAKAKPVETVEEILAKAKHAKVNPTAYAKAARRTAAAIRSDRFEWNRSKSTVDGILIHYFRTRGESLTGILGAAEWESWKGVTYKLILDDGTVTRLPGNRQLNRLIKDSGCVYQRVTVEYLGKIYKTSRHYEKVYAVHPAPLSAESIADTAEGRAALQKVRQAAGVGTPEKPKRTAKPQETPGEAKAIRRKFLQDMIGMGHQPTQRSLKEFRGETWADKALKEAGK